MRIITFEIIWLAQLYRATTASTRQSEVRRAAPATWVVPGPVL